MLRTDFYGNIGANIDSLHLRALQAPITTLRRSKERHTADHYPLQFSESRGNIAVLSADDASIDTVGIDVLANCGAQLMNSPLYISRRHAREHQDIVLANEQAVGLGMVGFTKPQDRFIFATDTPEVAKGILMQIRESFASVDIAITSEFIPVTSTDEWLHTNGGERPILPNVITPELTYHYIGSHNAQTQTALLQSALSNVAAYTKHGIQQLWQENDVPTPHTAYYDCGSESPQQIGERIQQNFRRYTHVVVNRVDGSGGYGMKFVPIHEATIHVQDSIFDNQEIQVQGQLPFITSPAIIANIHPNGHIEVLLASQQQFQEPGAHAGNVWHQASIDDLSELDPNFVKINMRALEALRDHGVVGQVNMDSIIIGEEDAMKLGIAQTTMREGNIRIGGSSIINRFRQGTIADLPITRVITSTKVKIPLKGVMDGSSIQQLNDHLPEDTKAILYNYNIGAQTASIAFCANDRVSVEDLTRYKQEAVAA